MNLRLLAVSHHVTPLLGSCVHGYMHLIACWSGVDPCDHWRGSTCGSGIDDALPVLRQCHVPLAQTARHEVSNNKPLGLRRHVGMRLVPCANMYARRNVARGRKAMDILIPDWLWVSVSASHGQRISWVARCPEPSQCARIVTDVGCALSYPTIPGGACARRQTSIERAQDLPYGRNAQAGCLEPFVSCKVGMPR